MNGGRETAELCRSGMRFRFQGRPFPPERRNALPERPALDQSRSFFDGQKLVGRDGLEGLDETRGPVDFDVRRRRGAETEVQARII